MTPEQEAKQARERPPFVCSNLKCMPVGKRRAFVPFDERRSYYLSVAEDGPKRCLRCDWKIVPIEQDADAMALLKLSVELVRAALEAGER